MGACRRPLLSLHLVVFAGRTLALHFLPGIPYSSPSKIQMRLPCRSCLDPRPVFTPFVSGVIFKRSIILRYLLERQTKRFPNRYISPAMSCMLRELFRGEPA
jgi:hypothetical protein